MVIETNIKNLKYNIFFYKRAYELIRDLDFIEKEIVFKTSERIELLEKINECSEGITNIIFDESELDSILDLSNINEIIKILESSFLKNDIKLSVVIMTYNEERCISRCLNSILKIADEIIVIDTGSKDRTKEIILDSFPNVKLYEVEWKNDFSEVRNKLIEFASGDWIFQLDADEFLSEGSIQLKEFLELFEDLPLSPLVISPVIINHNNQKLDFTRRIFKKTSNLKYFGLIHEDLRLDINKKSNDLLHILTDYTIFHDGYNEQIIKNKDKHIRNLRLEKKMIEIEPDNIRWYYFLAREKLVYGSDKKEIVDILQLGIKNKSRKQETDHFYLRSLILLAEIIEKDHNYINTIQNISNEINIFFPNNVDGAYLKAQMNFSGIITEFLHIIPSLLEELNKIESPTSIINEDNDHIYNLIGTIHLFSGNFEKALYTFSLIKDVEILKVVQNKLLNLNNQINLFFKSN